MEAKSDDIDLYLKLRGALIEYATPIIGCRARAEDVVQEAFIRFSQRSGAEPSRQIGKPRSRQAIDNPESYLFRIVRNLALDWLRRPDAETLVRSEKSESREEFFHSPEEALMYQNKLSLLAEALAELPERKRMAFTMYRLEGKTLQEIARCFDISVVRAHQLVKDAMRHALARLDSGD